MMTMEEKNMPFFSLFCLSTIVLIIAATTVVWINYFKIIKSIEVEFDMDNFNPMNVPNYAAHSAGAVILGKPEAKPYTALVLRIFSIELAHWFPADDDPNKLLQPWRGPGDCWAFAGSQASFRIKLSHTITPRAITLEHIPVQISPTNKIDSAPRHFSVYSYEMGSKGQKNLELLGHFEYDEDGPSLQSFGLNPEGEIRYPTRTIHIRIHSNHGHPHYTCIYRILVHGVKWE